MARRSPGKRPNLALSRRAARHEDHAARARIAGTANFSRRIGTDSMATAHELKAVPVTLDDVMRELVAIRALLEDRRRPPLSRDDRDQLAQILPAAAGAWGSEPFASRELAADAGVRVVLRGLSIKRVGKLLSRGTGTPINGLMLERAGHEINVNLWRVVAC
jgi:hypothetical protein